jgi:hypothetical protein
MIVMMVMMVMVVLYCYAFGDCGITMNFDMPPADFGKVVRIFEFRFTTNCGPSPCFHIVDPRVFAST